jgi:hypothetical protein
VLDRLGLLDGQRHRFCAPAEDGAEPDDPVRRGADAVADHDGFQRPLGRTQLRERDQQVRFCWCVFGERTRACTAVLILIRRVPGTTIGVDKDTPLMNNHKRYKQAVSIRSSSTTVSGA